MWVRGHALWRRRLQLPPAPLGREAAVVRLAYVPIQVPRLRVAPVAVAALVRALASVNDGVAAERVGARKGLAAHAAGRHIVREAPGRVPPEPQSGPGQPPGGRPPAHHPPPGSQRPGEASVLRAVEVVLTAATPV